MSQITVDGIFEEIKQLSDMDRLTLQKKLAEFTEAEWQVEVKKASGEAMARGIDQAAIDRAIERRRYG